MNSILIIKPSSLGDVVHALPVLSALRRHWPEYLIEAVGLGLFMIAAGLVTTALEHPASPLHRALPDPVARRTLIGLAMGLTAVGLIYSPWGRQSGAHLNPAVTLTFFRLSKVATVDAAFYVAACAALACAAFSLSISRRPGFEPLPDTLRA